MHPGILHAPRNPRLFATFLQLGRSNMMPGVMLESQMFTLLKPMFDRAALQ